MPANDTPKSSRDERLDFDPSYLNSLRELKFIAVIGSLALLWTISYGGLFGYTDDSEQQTLTLGMPSWVLWGIVAPWLTTSVATLLFAAFVIREDDDDLVDQDDQTDRTAQEHDA